jgi:hypothetical protein
MGIYQAQYQDCQNKLATGGLVGLAAGTACLADLYQKIKNLIKNPGTPLVTIPVSAPFPVVPVALTAVGSLILIYGLTRL